MKIVNNEVVYTIEDMNQYAINASYNLIIDEMKDLYKDLLNGRKEYTEHEYPVFVKKRLEAEIRALENAYFKSFKANYVIKL